MEGGIGEGDIRNKIFQEGPFFSHLAFANDLLLFRRATKKKVRGFFIFLDEYYRWFEKMINLQKSNVHFSKNTRGIKAWDLIRLLRFSLLPKSAQHLGLLFIFLTKKMRDLQFILDWVQKRLASWKAHNLSRAACTEPP